eukprot:gene29551-38668_t
MSLAEKSAQLPLKIAIAGAGVGGVMLAYALQKKGFDVTVFEKTSKFSRFGGPLQLASNALSCMNDVSPDLFDQVMGRFTFTGTRKCGIKDGIRNNWYSVFDAIKNLAEWNTLPYTGVIDRPDLQEILVDNLKDGTILNSKGISTFVENPDGTIDLNFLDGSVAKGFDVLVGADGIWSAVRSQLWNEPSARPGTCTYSGYTLFAAEMVMEPGDEFFKSEGYFDAGYKVYIGPGKYFVTSDVGSGRIQWYAFLALPPDTKLRSSNLEFLREQFDGWTQEIHACLNNTPEQIIEQRDLYDRRPSVWKSWSKGHMMPNLGQGACQAIEDAHVLAEHLCDVTDKSQIPDALKTYYQQRIFRSAAVQGLSRLSSDLIITAFTTPFDLKEFLEKGFNYKYIRPFLPAFFYMEFWYLYSFSPSTFDDEAIKELVRETLERNKKEVQKVYAKLKDNSITYFNAKSMSFMRFNKATGEHSKIGDAADFRDLKTL